MNGHIPDLGRIRLVSQERWGCAFGHTFAGSAPTVFINTNIINQDGQALSLSATSVCPYCVAAWLSTTFRLMPAAAETPAAPEAE